MSELNTINDTLKKNKERFNTELKIFINKKLFEKQVITEDMYYKVKEILVNQTTK
ncbi:MAG: hypothetical protein IKJ68_08560 [Clostridia bacterium]|nr:hypothetical protein [Clostridia bacterium]